MQLIEKIKETQPQKKKIVLTEKEKVESVGQPKKQSALSQVDVSEFAPNIYYEGDMNKEAEQDMNNMMKDMGGMFR